jgi:NRAMP (natural resistance-associated macrophage protein)-like metal ion transporter
MSQSVEEVTAGKLAGGAELQPGPLGMKKHHLKLFLAILGPGLVAMLADADVGSVVTAAQSGAQWGYKLLALQVLMIPVLYVVQELTVRLGIFTCKGHGELIRETFGRGWAWLSVAGLAVACLGALITEFAGISGVGLLFGVPQVTSLALAVTVLLVVVWTGSYRRVERIAIFLGLFELAFVWVAMRAPVQLVHGVSQYRSGHHAVDGVLPAICRDGQKAQTRSIHLLPLGHRNRSGAHPSGDGCCAGCRSSDIG